MRQTLLMLAILLVYTISFGQQFPTIFEKSKGSKTATYDEIISWWQKLDEASGKVKLLTMGTTDAGEPLHLVVVANNGDYDFRKIHEKHKRIILVNNGIHPGEPDGIDASMLLVRDIVSRKISISDSLVLAIIPVYNIGGCLNRSENYRVDQNGPEAFGWRGNAENLDLNRDFIKADSRNARTFSRMFHEVMPDVFLDNHVSNGADYQHIMTLITTQHSKLAGKTGEYMNKVMEPFLYKDMASKSYDLIPYVNTFGPTPEKGWPEFFDAPRYSSGYAAMWPCFSFTSETHMLKPYTDRVLATYALMKSMMDFTEKFGAEMQKVIAADRKAYREASELPVSWKLDRTRYSERIYKGYTAGYKPSEVSGQNRLYYDRSKPYEISIKLYNFYNPDLVIQKPEAYIIPQGWWRVIERLEDNAVQMERLKKDSSMMVEVYHIDQFKPAEQPYEMHHPNQNVTVTKTTEMQTFRKGDYLIPMNQDANRFIMEVLEPQAPDSYFAWNFFDGILQIKEGYSPYVFEETAANYLKDHPELQREMEEMRKTDSSFATNGDAQLRYVFFHSPYFEKAYKRYPVYRIPLAATKP